MPALPLPNISLIEKYRKEKNRNSATHQSWSRLLGFRNRDGANADLDDPNQHRAMYHRLRNTENTEIQMVHGDVANTDTSTLVGANKKVLDDV